MTAKEVEQYLLNIPRFTTKNEPEKTRAFLKELGDFSESIPTIHIAGTNGKGSVAAFLRAGLEANGLTVGMFTSPHLVSMRERFMVGERMISEDEFVRVFEYVRTEIDLFRAKPGCSDYHPTFFEFLFFMANVFFKSKRPDFVVLETGLGGRLDATNSISSPVISVITEIGIDHVEQLGETKEAIAYEKAGIIRPGVPVVHWSKSMPCDDVISNRANELSSKAYFVSKENIKNLETCGAGIDFSMLSLYDEFVKISLNSRALYQVENAAVSFEALSVLSEKFPEKIDINTCAKGFGSMVWPGRMERISDNFVIDGAHNEDGISAFLKSVAIDNCNHRTLLYSAVSDKNIEEVAKSITDSNLFDRICLCRLSSYRAASQERLLKAFENFSNLSFFETVDEGLSALMSECSMTDMLYAAGSLYLVGEIKAILEKQDRND